MMGNAQGEEAICSERNRHSVFFEEHSVFPVELLQCRSMLLQLPV